VSQFRGDAEVGGHSFSFEKRAMRINQCVRVALPHRSRKNGHPILCELRSEGEAGPGPDAFAGVWETLALPAPRQDMAQIRFMRRAEQSIARQASFLAWLLFRVLSERPWYVPCNLRVLPTSAVGGVWWGYRVLTWCPRVCLQYHVCADYEGRPTRRVAYSSRSLA
jgi:hypothetical protein